ncbi:hypothetical protein A1QO_02810 [Vibrio genomosp. F10 str. ZF-129]|uniref:Uncharacterized protein n=1 Tax=Vibrio genomosp. F10 str. ZF-129 TaxID=1187848 RepID=A0A1E5BKC6_9VIBR|nr:hypothetical protein [Vibrio genomosp. F10]OEE38327.1 hypothetical protein A1QO_02810 [Vibrio genomosp. F10 str. ZF-129]
MTSNIEEVSVNSVHITQQMKEKCTKVVWVVGAESLTSSSFDWFEEKATATNHFLLLQKEITIECTQLHLFPYEVESSLTKEAITNEIDGFYYENSRTHLFNANDLVTGYPFTIDAWMQIVIQNDLDVAVDNDDDDLPQWACQFGRKYFDKLPPELVKAISSTIEDTSWRQNDLPSITLAESEINGKTYSFRAWVGYDEEDVDKEILVFSLGLEINHEYESCYTQTIEGMFTDIDPMCRLDSELFGENVENIISLIQQSHEGMPENVLNYIKTVVIDTNAS